MPPVPCAVAIFFMYGETSANETSFTPRLWIAGLGSQYTNHLLRPDDFDTLAARFYDVKNPRYKRAQIQLCPS